MIVRRPLRTCIWWQVSDARFLLSSLSACVLVADAASVLSFTLHPPLDVTRTNCPSTEAEVNSFVDQILQEHPKDADFITALFYGSDCEVIRLVPLQVISDGCVHTYIDCVDFSHWVPGWTPDSPSVLSTSFHRPGDDSVRYIAVYERQAGNPHADNKLLNSICVDMVPSFKGTSPLRSAVQPGRCWTAPSGIWNSSRSKFWKR
ncbi:hypothetical protein HGRIS_004333 [Hohenbuehelia grisea]|uniref:Uncharacterized protein n=1 Tax=Hohenbuehelia grisea TaxID=104357 RepID=A0ABR3IPG3_9AGAR